MTPDTTFTHDRDRLLARFGAPATEEDVTLAVVSDVHVSPSETGTWKLFHRTESRLATAVADANRLGVDGVVLSGDLTKDGAPEEFEAVDALLSDLSAPAVAVPGNHDVPKSFDPHDTPALADFVDSYTPGSLPFRADLGGVDVVGLNSAAAPDGSLADGHAGHVSEDQLAWLAESVDPDRPTVAVFHHPAFAVHERVPSFSTADHLRVGNADAVAGALADAGVDLAVSGHVHWPAVARRAGVPHLTAPAACSFPQSYLLVRLTPEGATVTMVPLTDPEGADEALAHAERDGARDGTLAANLDHGYFESFPLADVASPSASPSAVADD
ncbi:metallophosphoesterase family protein [Halomarina ordinaria]|uniref:Metallophosphoesterase family protein n=1 Tax=Halomarina ordinaria TaxID=3033939 RepID=A0ABD5U8E5_9EURY|nr:metallophosphoesterase [Halomarina sp. PSRA2]